MYWEKEHGTLPKGDHAENEFQRMKMSQEQKR